MTVPTSKDYSKCYSERWNTAVQAGDYIEALDCGIKGYLIAKDVQDDAHKLAFLGLIRFAIEELIGPSSVKTRTEGDAEKRCSFCGRKENEVKLMAGAGAIICELCVGNIHEHFVKDRGGA